jgi:hypothetical protein
MMEVKPTLEEMRRISRGRTWISAATAILIVGAPAIADAATPSGRTSWIPPGRVMKESEIKNIYSAKTWTWSSGGGYFNSDGSFIAYVGSSRDKSIYAKGKWFADDDGKMCFEATWYTRSNHSASTTCFEHRKQGTKIYQRKAPSGPWYVFKHAPTRQRDEVNKLRPGDRISSRANRLETAFSKQQGGGKAEGTSSPSGATTKENDGAAKVH